MIATLHPLSHVHAHGTRASQRPILDTARPLGCYKRGACREVGFLYRCHKTRFRPEGNFWNPRRSAGLSAGLSEALSEGSSQSFLAGAGVDNLQREVIQLNEPENMFVQMHQSVQVMCRNSGGACAVLRHPPSASNMGARNAPAQNHLRQVQFPKIRRIGTLFGVGKPPNKGFKDEIH